MCDLAGLQVADHPVRWRRAVSPSDLGEGELLFVPGGAFAAGTRTDAIIAVDDRESMRRSSASLAAVTSLALLDTLFGLPLGCPIRLADLNDRELRILRTAPEGCVEFTGTSVTRTLQVPTTVLAAVLRGDRWRVSLRRAAAFSALTQRIVVLPSAPDAATVLEAQVAGVGIWIEAGTDRFVEHLAPAPFVPVHFKPAGWRFAENAYASALRAGVAGHVLAADVG